MLNSPAKEIARPAIFELENDAAYRVWRDEKLANYPRDAGELIVEINDILALNSSEISQIRECVHRANMAIYHTNLPHAENRSGKDMVKRLGEQFGLLDLDKNIRADDDGISALRDVADPNHHEYIPYSNRPISWHTDGYYNRLDRLIRGMILHCASPAVEGGENALLDYEILYIQLRDQNPEMIRALMQDTVMTIPENVENGVMVRPAQTGPVFSFDPDSGDLHMRYTARTRSIEWLDAPHVKEAVSFIKDFLASDTRYILRHRLSAGEGIICNNVLHNRSAFTDDKAAGHERLIYRGRFYQRMAIHNPA